ncbi:hypothetical protein HCN44_007014 [Aphidius gifuensis]|uniref:MYND-type domain-containing protein n=1 Tax=Aphidius gifuensis TaxID=684658 RepID=A0A834Y1J4_APHGI|nr:SET and MYND domain-containing protein 4-like isoform X1 [Aphidius gifuensis]XP_044004254.1 SET and MYND domain-containing protein 4-like isoform X1 [Aphidius gifuensis]KAF7995907.1 hypothetical protein HCN44_007014 [Aphidius gifuensis]
MYCKVFPDDDKIIAKRLFSQQTTFKDKFEVAWKFSASYINKSRNNQGSKSVVDSIRWRTTGNTEYTATSKNEDYISKSIEAYTKSIVFAPVGSEELSLAYANRSAVLFRARLYEDCLLDIERALKSGYPDELKTKLFLRQSLCFKALKKSSDIESSALASATKWLPNLKKNISNHEMFEKYTKMMNELGKPRNITTFSPEIKNNFSKDITGASDAIDLKKTSNNGQHIVAKRMIKSGEFIYISEPFAATVINELHFTNCWHCSRQTWAGIPCDNCLSIIYCSDICQQKAWDSYHNLECLVLGQLLKSDEMNTQTLLAVKILLKALNSVGGLIELKKKIDNIDSMINDGMIFTTDTLDVNTIDNFHRLDYIKPTSTECKFESALLAVWIVTIFGQKTNVIGSKMAVAELIDYKSKRKFILGELILRYMMIVQLNTGFFTEIDFGGSVGQSSVLIPFCKLIKKSCDPNVYWNHFGSNVGFYASKPIKQGKPILLSTAGSYHMIPKINRWIQLEPTTNDHVPCRCTACFESWPTIQSLKSYHDSTELPTTMKTEFDDMMSDLNEWQKLIEEGDDDKLLEIKDELISMNDEFYRYITVPCKEISLLYLSLNKLYGRLCSVNKALE